MIRRRRFAGWQLDPQERPLSRGDVLRMAGLAAVTVVVGVLAAPYLGAVAIAVRDAWR